MVDAGKARGDALVLFGASGDLARKMLFPALYRLAAAGQLGVPVIGVAATDWDDAALSRHAAEAVGAAEDTVDAATLSQLQDSLAMVSGDYRDTTTFDRLARTLSANGATRPVHYLAIPPSLFEVTVRRLHSAGLTRGARVVVEKPFGRDLASAQELNRLLHEVFTESAIFRIDHFLGKEPVENLLVFRFANSFLEPIWNRRYIASVQISLTEDFGVEAEAASMTRWAPSATSSRTTCCRWWRCWRWSRRSTPTPTRYATRRSRCSRLCSRPTRRTWCEASTPATATSPAWPSTPLWRPTPR
jgi:glucose-6-phosphate 1-dehydrogenase